MNISEGLNVANRTVSYRDAEVFMAHVLGVERAYLHTHNDRVLNAAEIEKYEKCLVRREQNEPVAYITGVKEFYGRPFDCDFRALIPRPETEGIVDMLMPWLKNRFTQQVKETNKPCVLHVLELGTGAGNVAVTVAAEAALQGTPLSIIATDLAPEALELATQNGKKLVPENRYVSLNFVQADMFDAEEIKKLAPFDAIVANLPYVEDTWIMHPDAQPDVIFHEPDVALFGGGDDGLALYRQFFAEAKDYLKPDGMIAVEHGEAQGEAIKALAEASDIAGEIKVHKDYADLDRITTIIP